VRRLRRLMCMQCAAGAMTAGTAALGMRQWLLSRAWAWLTPRRRHATSATLVTAGVVAAGLIGTSAL